MKKIKLSVVVFLILAAGCKKQEEYSVIPEITFKSLTTQKDANGFDTKAHVVISFTDGDGDIGYHSSGNGSPYDDSLSIYYYNFVVLMDSLHLGNWVPDNVIKLSGRIPYLTQEGSNKALKGEIAMDIPAPTSLFGIIRQYQIRYHVFIYDRALNKSNSIVTSEIDIRIH